MNEFEQNGWVLVEGFIDPQGIQTISRYLEYSLNQGQMVREENSVVNAYCRYADPLTETISYNSLADIEAITGNKLYSTYSISRVHVEGCGLKHNIDRESCEVSVTIHVATKGEPWLFWLKSNGREPVGLTLKPGDAVIYKGCEITHWREETDKTDVNVQIMLHYVNQNGPNAKYKYDTRPALGLPQSTRSI